MTWQRQMAVDRSRGQFFKSLYQADLEEEEIKGQPQQRFKVRPVAITSDGGRAPRV